MESVVATGVWLYDNTAPTMVRVVALDYDFWHEIGVADGDLEPDEAPQLNREGVLYYVLHRPGWPDGGRSFWPDSQGFHTLAQAMAHAESTVPGPIAWR